jgi:hypothetical protein
MGRVMPLPWREITCPVVGCKARQIGQCFVFAGIEAGKWHMSISHPGRYPTWDEIKEARYRFVPNEVTMGMILPPREQYVNLHPNCFHLHEIEGEHERP